MLKRERRTWVEWSCWAFGILIVLGSLGFLAYDSGTSEAQAAVLDTSVGHSLPQNDQVLIPVTVRNEGNRAVEAVVVEVFIHTNNEQRERVTFQIPRLARHASQQVMVVSHSGLEKLQSVDVRIRNYAIVAEE